MVREGVLKVAIQYQRNHHYHIYFSLLLQLFNVKLKAYLAVTGNKMPSYYDNNLQARLYFVCWILFLSLFFGGTGVGFGSSGPTPPVSFSFSYIALTNVSIKANFLLEKKTHLLILKYQSCIFKSRCCHCQYLQ